MKRSVKSRRAPRPLSLLELSLERLEDRRLLSVADPNLPGNDCAPELDLTGLSAADLTINAGAAVSINLYERGATLNDTQGGVTFNDFAAGRLLLKGDAALTNATLSTAGDFSFMPTDAQSGTSITFTVMALDRPTDRTQPPRVDAETFTVVVRPANQAPSFTLADNPMVDEDPDPAQVTIDNFATNIDDGDDDSDQTLTFDVTVTSNAALFAAGGGPQIDATTGALTFTPAANANGSANVSVTLMDDGGMAAGGVDTSAAQTFTITVNAVNDDPTVNVPTQLVDVAEDMPVTISGITVADIDLDETPGAQVQVTLAVNNGVLTLTTLTGLDFSSAGASGSGTNDPTMTFFGSLADVNAALAAGLTYQGNLNFNGADVLTVTVDDLGNTGAAPPAGNQPGSATININVNAVDDEPTLSGVVDQSALDSEPTLLLPITVADVDLGSGEIEITLAVTEGTLSIIPPVAGLAAPAGDGTPAAPLTFQGTLDQVNTALSRLFYQPATGAATPTLTVTANDQPGGAPRATETATITVIADTNLAPTITDPLPPTGSTVVTLEPTEGEAFTQVFTAMDTPDETLVFNVSAEVGSTVPDGLAFGAVTETSPGVYTATLMWPDDMVIAGMFENLNVNVADAGVGNTGLGQKSDTVAIELNVIRVFTVNTANDKVDANIGDGLAEDEDGNTSLRAAIQEANATPGKAKIVVPADTYTLTITGADEDEAATGDLDITDELVIEGAGAASTIIDAGGDAGGALGDRVFDIHNAFSARFEGVKITGGFVAGNGGGVRNRNASELTIGGELSIVDSEISGNMATGASDDGGGIYNYNGALTVSGSTISGNTSGDRGGGVYSGNYYSGSVSISSSTVSRNTAVDDGGGIYLYRGELNVIDSTVSGNESGDRGGGIYHYGRYGGAVTITDSTVSRNIATDNGGGISVRGYGSHLTVTDSTISGNASDGGGGGIYSYGRYSETFSVINSIVSGNMAAGDGGGIFNYDYQGGGVSISNSTVSGNVATRSGGGIFNGFGAGETNSGPLLISDSTFSQNMAGRFGGGILHQSDSNPLTLRDSTVSENTADMGGGGLNNATQLGVVSAIVNSTVSGNSTPGGGGGVSNSFGELEIHHSTITNNTAPAASGSGVASFGDPADTSTTVVGSIVAGNTNDDVALIAAVVNDTANTFESGGFTIVGSGADFDGGNQNAIDAFMQTGDQTGVDPMLGPLQLGGGTTETHALLPGSPAIDMGDPNFDPAAFDPDLTTDQRGDARVRGGTIDVGSFESDFVVNSEADAPDSNPGDGVSSAGGANSTLRSAIMEANALPGPNTIVIGAGQFFLDLAGGDEDAAAVGDLDITDNLTIIGAGAGRTIIDAAGGTTVVKDRIFHVLAGARVHLVGLTISGGDIDAASGGGILIDEGELTLVESEVRDNKTTGASSGGGIAVMPDQSLTVIRSTIADNETEQGGGGIDNFVGQVTVIASTISGNNVTNGGQSGGGIRNNGGPLNVFSSTVTGNRALGGGSGISTAAEGGVARLQNSIVAGNFVNAADSEVQAASGGAYTSLGNNLIGSITNTVGFVDGANGDQVGTFAAPIDAKLGDLADNGGPTRTHALQNGSPALDAGNNSKSLATDQRGETRTVDLPDGSFPNAGDGTDIGAFEAQAEPPVLAGNNASGAQLPLAPSPTPEQPLQLEVAAQTRLIAAGVESQAVAALADVTVEIVDLADGLMGLATETTIYLDDDAEFRAVDGVFDAIDGGDAAGRVDLLSVLVHELGHVLGEEDRFGAADADHWMFGKLARGVRQVAEIQGLDDAIEATLAP